MSARGWLTPDQLGLQDLADRQMPPEQLIYAAALASGSQLVYGDVPKLTSIRNLWEQASLQELDVHFSRQAAANFHSLLNKGAIVLPDSPASNRAFQILFADREVAFCQTMRACTQQLDPQQSRHHPQSAQDARFTPTCTDAPGSTKASDVAAASQSNLAHPSPTGSLSGKGGIDADAQPAVQLKAGAGSVGSVVGIVGEDHVEGIQQTWAQAGITSPSVFPARSQAHAALPGDKRRSPLLHGVDGQENAGVKRAVLERMLGLAIPEDLALSLCQQVKK